jgi:Animal haem peroxidase
MIRPYRSSPPDRYCRLFRRNLREVSEETIELLGHLAFSMLLEDDAQSRIPIARWKKQPPPAGYTYFGQFIDHDLTEDDTAMRDVGEREPWETVNYRGPWLNLSGIYDPSHDRGRWKALYEPDGLRFRLGTPRRTENGEPFDLPLDDRGQPVLVDDRNNENIIIRQIHVMFLKLHNLAIEELRAQYPFLPNEKLFAGARDRVCWQYQYLVRHDFLARVCHPLVFEELVTKNGPSSIDWATGGFSIPVELAQAGLRFGHSMVRAEYTLSVSGGKVSLDKLLSSGRPGGLRPEEAVHWPTFLDIGELAMRIDTGIASGLFGLENKDIHSYVDSPSPHLPHALPVRTLVRGAKTRLPSGQDVAKKFGMEAIVIEAPGTVGGQYYDPGKALSSTGLNDATPLWYYLLLEAELDPENWGATLGVLGSRLLIETVNGALRGDPDSYLCRFGPGWEPPAWRIGRMQVKRLPELARLVGLYG